MSIAELLQLFYETGILALTIMLLAIAIVIHAQTRYSNKKK